MSGRRKGLLWRVGLGLSLAASVAWADLEQARRLYQQARATQDAAARAVLLRESLAAEETYEAGVALGETLHELGQTEEARRALQRALELAGTDKARARAYYVLGETYAAAGELQEALSMMRRSVQLFEHPQVRTRLRALDLQAASAPMSSDEIRRSLAGTSTRAFAVQPSVTLRIGFALNSAELDESGLKQARELGSALSDSSLAGRQFKIVGHTDKQGEAAYNDTLSLRRAETVRSFLITEYKLSADRLSAEGHGEKELLYPGDTPEDHALNRRVEVVVPR